MSHDDDDDSLLDGAVHALVEGARAVAGAALEVAVDAWVEIADNLKPARPRLKIELDVTVTQHAGDENFGPMIGWDRSEEPQPEGLAALRRALVLRTLWQILIGEALVLILTVFVPHVSPLHQPHWGVVLAVCVLVLLVGLGRIYRATRPAPADPKLPIGPGYRG